MSDQLKMKEFHQAEGAQDWRIVSDGACAFYRTRSLAEAARFVHAIGEVPGIEDHPPAVDIRHDGVTVRLVTLNSEYMGMTTTDLDLARLISDKARELGLSADPSAIQSVLIVPGALDIKQVMPFWRAVLGYDPRPDSPEEDLVDPHDRGPAFWFEGMEQPRADGGGAIHIAVWLPIEQAQARVDAALAAGGRMVRDDFAPAWWTLADAAGNEADIATTEYRDGPPPTA